MYQQQNLKRSLQGRNVPATKPRHNFFHQIICLSLYSIFYYTALIYTDLWPSPPRQWFFTLEISDTSQHFPIFFHKEIIDLNPQVIKHVFLLTKFFRHIFHLFIQKGVFDNVKVVSLSQFKTEHIWPYKPSLSLRKKNSFTSKFFFYLLKRKQKYRFIMKFISWNLMFAKHRREILWTYRCTCLFDLSKSVSYQLSSNYLIFFLYLVFMNSFK